MSDQDLIFEMCKRVGLSSRVGNKIYTNMLLRKLRKGLPVDMVLIAKAIKYVSENKQHLLPTYRLYP